MPARREVYSIESPIRLRQSSRVRLYFVRRKLRGVDPAEVVGAWFCKAVAIFGGAYFLGHVMVAVFKRL